MKLENSKKLIQDYMTSVSLLDEEERVIKEARKALHQKLLDSMRSMVETGKVCTLVLPEYRDDRVSCFQVAQTAKVVVTSIYMSSVIPGLIVPLLRKILYTPTGKPKMKGGNLDTREVNFNAYCAWTLQDENGEVLLENKVPDVIYPDKYSDEELEQIRERLMEVQKI